MEWYTRAVEQCHSIAQFNLGCRYGKEQGVAKDYTKALEWHTRATEQGNSRAQFILGCCYANGRGVAKDKNKAREWYLKSGLNSVFRIVQLHYELIVCWCMISYFYCLFVSLVFFFVRH